MCVNVRVRFRDRGQRDNYPDESEEGVDAADLSRRRRIGARVWAFRTRCNFRPRSITRGENSDDDPDNLEESVIIAAVGAIVVVVDDLYRCRAQETARTLMNARYRKCSTSAHVLLTSYSLDVLGLLEIRRANTRGETPGK